MTPPRLGRKHLIFGAVLTVIGLALFFDAFSPSYIVHIGGLPTRQRDSWFFPNMNGEREAEIGVAAIAVAVVWVRGSIGWCIVRTIIQLWLHKAWRDANPR